VSHAPAPAPPVDRSLPPPSVSRPPRSARGGGVGGVGPLPGWGPLSGRRAARCVASYLWSGSHHPASHHHHSLEMAGGRRACVAAAAERGRERERERDGERSKPARKGTWAGIGTGGGGVEGAHGCWTNGPGDCFGDVRMVWGGVGVCGWRAVARSHLSPRPHCHEPTRHRAASRGVEGDTAVSLLEG
jgi:hypothetical protein